MAQFEAREIGARISAARKEAGLTQEELAEMASFSKRSLQDYENGVTIPYKQLQELGRLLKREVAWFLHGDEATPDDLRVVLDRQAEEIRELSEQVRGQTVTLQALIDALEK